MLQIEGENSAACSNEPDPVTIAEKSTTANGGCGDVVEVSSVHRPPSMELHGLHPYLTREDVSKAEIWWSLFSVQHHISLRSAGIAYKMFPKMFPDSVIASRMELGKTKISYNIVHGLAPYFHDIVVKDVNDTDCFVVFFDESLNKFSQQQQMDICLRYWDKLNDQVTSRYFTSAFLGHATANDLLKAFLESLKPLMLRKILQVSMDGPNVNLKMIKDFETYLKSIGNPDHSMFVFMGTCGLHVGHNAFKTGFNDKTTEWHVISFLRAVYNLFKDVPSRKSDLIRYSGSSLLPLKFCSVRWLNNSYVAKRAKELLPNLSKFKTGIESDNSHAGIKSYSYGVVKEALKDKLMPCKLAFLALLLKKLNHF